jgi:hypothetical protein
MFSPGGQDSGHEERKPDPTANHRKAERKAIWVVRDEGHGQVGFSY